MSQTADQHCLFGSKKVFRWVEHGTKVEFHKNLPFAPNPSVSKRRAVPRHQTTYEDLRMLKSVVRPQDWMLSLDMESAFFHVPIHPSIENSFRRIWLCRSLSTTSLSICNQEVTLSAQDQTLRLWCPRLKHRRICDTIIIKSSSSLM